MMESASWTKDKDQGLERAMRDSSLPEQTASSIRFSSRRVIYGDKEIEVRFSALQGKQGNANYSGADISFRFKGGFLNHLASFSECCLSSACSAAISSGEK